MASVDIRNHSYDNIIIHGRPWTSVIFRVIILSSMASVDIRNHSCDNIIIHGRPWTSVIIRVII